MRVLGVHPGPLMYTRIFLRLEPLGLELVAAAARQAGHEVALVDLQVEKHQDFFRWVDRWRPDLILFSCNYLANVPEIVDLAKAAKARLPRTTVCVGGHSVSFVAAALIEHGEGAIDCVIRGEGEAAVPFLLAALEAGTDLTAVPGAVTADGQGPAPGFVSSLDDLLPARDLLRHRRKYFLGVLDPCASIEFSRGCPWDCSFCSAWTFYGRSYRVMSHERVIEDLRSIREPGQSKHSTPPTSTPDYSPCRWMGANCTSPRAWSVISWPMDTHLPPNRRGGSISRPASWDLTSPRCRPRRSLRTASLISLFRRGSRSPWP